MTTSPPVAAPPRRYGHFIGGRWVDGREEIDRAAPATGQVVSTVAAGEASDVDAAVAAARRAFDDGPWPRMTGFERAALLHRVADLIDAHADLFARLDAEEGGKPVRLSRGDVAGAARWISSRPSTHRPPMKCPYRRGGAVTGGEVVMSAPCEIGQRPVRPGRERRGCAGRRNRR